MEWRIWNGRFQFHEDRYHSLPSQRHHCRSKFCNSRNGAACRCLHLSRYFPISRREIASPSQPAHPLQASRISMAQGLRHVRSELTRSTKSSRNLPACLWTFSLAPKRATAIPITTCWRESLKKFQLKLRGLSRQPHLRSLRHA